MKTPCVTPECPYGLSQNNNSGLCNKCYGAKFKRELYQKRKEAKPKKRTISEKDLETLQRYTETNYAGIDGYYVEESDTGEYVRWDALIQLLK